MIDLGGYAFPAIWLVNQMRGYAFQKYWILIGNHEKYANRGLRVVCAFYARFRTWQRPDWLIRQSGRVQAAGMTRRLTVVTPINHWFIDFLYGGRVPSWGKLRWIISNHNGGLLWQPLTRLTWFLIHCEGLDLVIWKVKLVWWFMLYLCCYWWIRFLISTTKIND